MANVGHLVKESLVQELSSELDQHPNFIVTSINRLTAPDADALRQKLHGSNARLFMVKRKLGRRAVEKLNLQGLAELLEGSVALVLAGDDVLPAAKLIVEFRKAHEEQLTVRGAVVDGQLLDRSHVEQLAALPPRPVLLAQVLGTIEAPIADVIFTLERLLGDLAWLAEQAAAKKPAEVAPAPKAEAAPAPDAAPAGEATPDVKPTEPNAQNTEEGKG